jgi:TPR repeat protein
LISGARYFKLSADQGNADGQCCYGRSLRDGTGISKDLISAAHYFELSADQGSVDDQCSYGRHLRDIAATSSISYFFWAHNFMQVRNFIAHCIVRPGLLDAVSFVQNGWKVTYFVQTRYVKGRSRRSCPRWMNPNCDNVFMIQSAAQKAVLVKCWFIFV